MNESPQNTSAPPDEKSPRFGKDDNFIPLGFSSPINQRQPEEGDIYPSQRRSFEFFSAKRPTFRNNYRNNRYQPNNRRSNDNKGHQNHHHQPKNNRKNFCEQVRQQQPPCVSKTSVSFQSQTPGKRADDDRSYFHPSMLEDPWRNLMANLERRRANSSQTQPPRTQEPSADQSPAQSSDSKED